MILWHESNTPFPLLRSDSALTQFCSEAMETAKSIEKRIHSFIHEEKMKSASKQFCTALMSEAKQLWNGAIIAGITCETSHSNPLIRYILALKHYPSATLETKYAPAPNASASNTFTPRREGGTRSAEWQGCATQKSKIDSFLGKKFGVKIPILRKKYPFLGSFRGSQC